MSRVCFHCGVAAGACLHPGAQALTPRCHLPCLTALPALCSSEVRLLEIVEGLCEASDFECNRLLEEQEELLEAWWLRL